MAECLFGQQRQFGVQTNNNRADWFKGFETLRFGKIVEANRCANLPQKQAPHLSRVKVLAGFVLAG